MRTLSAAIIGIAFIVGLFIVGNAYKYRSTSKETITVTGSAEKDFVSDLIVWKGSYSRKSMDLKAAYAQLKDDESVVKKYLLSKGVQEDEMVFSSINIIKEFSYPTDANGRSLGQQFSGYNLTQNVRIESPNVDKINAISREATELIQQGIEFNSDASVILLYKTYPSKNGSFGKGKCRW